MSAEKRSASNSFGSSQLVKRQKSDANLDSSALTRTNGAHGQAGAGSASQTPVTELIGHSGEIFAARFDRTGQRIASASMDRSILLWNATGEIKSYALLEGHKGAVLDVHWSRDAGTLFSASADATLASWDTETGQRTRRHIGHEGVINAMDISKHGKETLVSACDDGYIGIWDARQRDIVDFMETSFPVTAVAFAENGIELFSGGIDNDIKVWDMRKKQVTYVMKGHQDTITSLEISPDTRTLLSNSHDSTVRTWNIQPFEGGTNRLIKSYDGAPTGMEKNLLKASWDANGERIAAGSGDRSTVVWDVRSGKLLHKLPGHRGAVNDVRFSPGEEPTILSASSDRTLLLGELKK